MYSSQHPLGELPEWSELHVGVDSACRLQSIEFMFVVSFLLHALSLTLHTMHGYQETIYFFQYAFIHTHKIIVIWIKRFYINRCKSPKWWKQDVTITHVVKVECNDSPSPLCRRCWVGWEFPYLGRLVRNMFPWLQKSWGGGEPDAEQTRRMSSPREKAWRWGWTTTDGASTVGVKHRQEADDDSVFCHCCMMSFMTSLSQV